jgi:hypothetical protein
MADDDANLAQTPDGWLEALAESEAELAAGKTVPGEVVKQRLRDSLVRMEAKQAAVPKRGTTARR